MFSGKTEELIKRIIEAKLNGMKFIVFKPTKDSRNPYEKIVSHSKTEMEIIKELASNDKAYRSLTKSWFINSPLFELVKNASSLGFKLIITTDHGTINVKNPSKIIGDRNSSQNLSYKTGRSLTSD